MFIAPYKLGSDSAKALAQALGIKRITGEKLIKPGTTVINWGNSMLRRMPPSINVVNTPQAVAVAANKYLTFNALLNNNVSIPEYTLDSGVARQWLNEGNIVYGRASLTASQGLGINVFTPEGGEYFLDHLPLYTKGVARPHEYRVHVFNGEVIDYTKKRRRSGVDTNDMIRNSSTGWVFCRDEVALPFNVAANAVMAVDALRLNFGAVDVVYKAMEDKAYVLEVNTAPGLEGTTLERYATTIRRMYG